MVERFEQIAKVATCRDGECPHEVLTECSKVILRKLPVCDYWLRWRGWHKS